MGLKYIAPGSWFSLEYPAGWHEFEDADDTFLFYNPNKWGGNFRISAYRGKDDAYAENCMADELKSVPGAKVVKIGKWKCVYSAEDFQEDGTWYTTHVWITGEGSVSVECSFTTFRGEPCAVAEDIISSLHVKGKADKPVEEIIPVRVLEINEINEGFEWAVSTLKKKLAKDFTSVFADMALMQKVMDDGTFDKGQKRAWMSFGYAFGTILFNEIDGMEWVTLISGDKECPALRFKDTDVVVCPGELVWNRVKCEGRCDLNAEFEKIRRQVEEVL